MLQAPRAQALRLARAPAIRNDRSLPPSRCRRAAAASARAGPVAQAPTRQLARADDLRACRRRPADRDRHHRCRARPKRFAAEIDKRGGYVKTVVLHSPGGSVQDALQIGRLIREKKFNTEVEDGALLRLVLPADLCRRRRAHRRRPRRRSACIRFSPRRCRRRDAGRRHGQRAARLRRVPALSARHGRRSARSGFTRWKRRRTSCSISSRTNCCR